MFLVPTLRALSSQGVAVEELDAAVVRAWRAGVPLALGNDAGVVPHGENGAEFERLVAAGIPPGRVVDLVAVQGDPIAAPAALMDIRFAMQGGRVVVEPER